VFRFITFLVAFWNFVVALLAVPVLVFAVAFVPDLPPLGEDDPEDFLPVSEGMVGEELEKRLELKVGSLDRRV
jgi:hypothetical protein